MPWSVTDSRTSGRSRRRDGPSPVAEADSSPGPVVAVMVDPVAAHRVRDADDAGGVVVDHVVGRCLGHPADGDGAGVVGVRHGVLEQRVHGRDELAPVAEDGHRRVGLTQDDRDVPLLGGGPHPLDGLGHHQVDQHRLARGCLLGLDPAEVQEVVDDPADPERLGVDAAGQARRDLGVGLADQGLGQQAQGAHRCLQLMADVGHEVPADLLEAAALRDVVDHGDDPEGPAAVVDQPGPHGQGPAGRPVEIEGALGGPLVPGVLEQLGDRLGRQGVPVAAGHEGVGPAVAVDHRARLVADDHPLGQGVERPAQPDGVRAGLGDGLRGRPGDLLEIGQRHLDAALVLRRIEPESRAESHEALRKGPATGAAPDVGGDDGHQDQQHHHDGHDRRRRQPEGAGQNERGAGWRHTPSMAGPRRPGERPPPAPADPVGNMETTENY